MMARSLTGHTSNVNVLELLSNGYLASGSTDTYTIIWDTSSGVQISKFLAVNSKAVTCMKQVKSTQLFIGGADQSIYFWDISNMASPNRLAISASYLTGGCTDMCMFDTDHLVVSCQSSTVYCWSVSTQNMVKSIDSTPNTVLSLEYLSMAFFK